MAKKDMQHKVFAFDLTETKEISKDGQNYGIIKGYASTYGNIDRTGDIIEEGAFTKSIARHKKTNRPITMLLQHSGNNIIGGFPIDKVKDDSKGLFMEGEINLSVQSGQEAYALAKQGVLSDLSIGFSAEKYEIFDDGDGEGYRFIELELWEVSIVSEPANEEAVITDVKSINDFECMKDVEAFFKNPFCLSGNQRKTLISKIKAFSRDAENTETVRDAHNEIQKRLELNEVEKRLDELNKLLNKGEIHE